MEILSELEKVIQELEAELKCQVCQKGVDNPMRPENCFHIGHEECILGLLKKNQGECLVCSKRIGKPIVVKNMRCHLSVLKEIKEEIAIMRKDLTKTDSDLEQYAVEIAEELEDLVRRGK